MSRSSVRGASNDSALLAVSISGEHQLISLDRGGDGLLAAGAVTAVENDWPLEILRAEDGNALVHRGFLASEPVFAGGITEMVMAGD